jgi:hypothetical protein
VGVCGLFAWDKDKGHQDMKRMVFILMVVLMLALTAQAGSRVKSRNAPTRSTSDDSAQRIALVIGNASYKKMPLPNPVNDARDMAAKLEELGFEVIKYENLRTMEMGKALRKFRERIQPGAVAIFFYAGHGLQLKGVNYLPTVDNEISGEDDVSVQSLDVNKIFALMEEAKSRLNLVFLDACRNNPYTRGFRSMEGGLAKVTAPSGTLISFATRPGSTASDGDGRNGLYTQNLLAAMDMPNLPIEQMLKQVVRGVKEGSGGAQEPWSEGSIEGEFYFRGGAQSSGEDVERTLWASIKDSPIIAPFDAYLTHYPNGLFVQQAKEAKVRILTQQAEEAKARLTIQQAEEARARLVIQQADEARARLVIQQAEEVKARVVIQQAEEAKARLATQPAEEAKPAEGTSLWDRFIKKIAPNPKPNPDPNSAEQAPQDSQAYQAELKKLAEEREKLAKERKALEERQNEITTSKEKGNGNTSRKSTIYIPASF